MRRTLVALAVAIALPLAVPVATASAQPLRHARVHNEMRDVRRAQGALREDLRDRRRYAVAGNRAGVLRETRQIQHDKRRLNREQRDVRRAVVRHRRIP